MNRTTIMLFSLITGAILADLTHPAGQRFWADLATDSEMGCAADCLEPEEERVKLTCWAKKTYVRCEVVEEQYIDQATENVLAYIRENR